MDTLAMILMPAYLILLWPEFLSYTVEFLSKGVELIPRIYGVRMPRDGHRLDGSPGVAVF